MEDIWFFFLHQAQLSFLSVLVSGKQFQTPSGWKKGIGEVVLTISYPAIRRLWGKFHHHCVNLGHHIICFCCVCVCVLGGRGWNWKLKIQAFKHVNVVQRVSAPIFLQALNCYFIMSCYNNFHVKFVFIWRLQGQRVTIILIFSISNFASLYLFQQHLLYH